MPESAVTSSPKHSGPVHGVDPVVYLEFAQASTQVATADDFRALIRTHVRKLMPHAMLLACMGRLAFDQIEAIKLLGVDVPEAYLEQVPKVTNVRERPGMMYCLEKRAPVVAGIGVNEHLLSDLLRAELQRYNMGIVAAHGVLDLSSNMGTYFSFWRVDPSLSVAEIESILNLMCPLLHTALVRVHDLACVLPDPGLQLTDIEREILTWLAAGRTNAEMAKLRGRSPSTIRNQLESLYRKLGVGNRTEAAQLAIGRGLI